MLRKPSCQGEDPSIVILSDSLSAIQCLSNRNNAYHNLDIHRILSLISEFKDQGQQITLVLVPAHVGIPGNEKAGFLGNNATTKGQIDSQIPATVKDTRRFVARTIEGDWQKRWDCSLDSHHRELQEQVSTRNFFQCAPRKKKKKTHTHTHTLFSGAMSYSSCYAEDINKILLLLRWCPLDDLRTMTTRMQKQLNKTANFLSANGFKISASKSQAVLFTNSRVKRSEANIRLRIGKEQILLSQRLPS